ncbi:MULTISPECIES: hypothetical protein [unclassified Mycobacterium]|uniref:hypothetical protein n=1 Tax=unclassified Mycobacterium TaxID=2642494 RepID=UPI0029C90F2F|nr:MULTISPECIES: hypothetical protein [unclassified Mycobacterium]
MHEAVRPHAAAGVALLAASALAVSPLTPPMPDVQATVQRAVSSVAVELDAVVNPLESFTQLVLNTANNVAGLGTQFATDPAPILGQLITNQGANAAVLGDALQQAITFYQGFLPTIPSQLQTIADQLKAGDIADAVNSAFQLPLGAALGLAVALPAINQIAVNSSQNFANAVNAIAGPDSPVLLLALTAITPVYAGLTNFGTQAQDVLDSVKSGDLPDAIGAALSIPTEVVNGILNGTGAIEGLPGVTSPGLLTSAANQFGAGLVSGLLGLRDTIADSLKPLAPPTSAFSTLAAPAAKTVTLKSLEAAPPKTEADATADDSTAATDATAKDSTAAKDATAKDATAKDATAAKDVTSKDATTKDATVKDSTKDATTTKGVSSTKSATDTKDAAGTSDTTTKPAKADKTGRHRAQADNPVSSAVKKIRDSVKKASGESKHAKADSGSSKSSK